MQRILIATEGSPDAGKALDYALDIASGLGIELMVVDMLEPPAEVLGASSPASDDPPPIRTRRARLSTPPRK